MSLTTDPNDPRLRHEAEKESGPQDEVYLVLSEEERAKGFTRPVRSSYRHVGPQGPKYPLRDLTDEEHERYPEYAKFEVYPESESSKTGKYWTQAQLDAVGKGCQTVTTMGQAIAETYARDPSFYSHTYCVQCGKHLPVAEFVWVHGGTVVGS